ncbi:MAG: zinc-binding dehydrogenase [Candidatus Hydrogenedentes bacterium]|nr:zinc-binding dehydrogenase [Candidatus Hydrogenedentota bacterium]
MRQLQITAPGQFAFVEAPRPEPGPGEVLIRVLAVTTCPHWDLHIMSGEPMFPGGTIEYPYTAGQPGHEACGDVIGVGNGVHEFAVGDRVCVWRDPGHHLPGCYADYVARPVSDVIKVPRELPPEACAPLELAMCVSAHMQLAERLDAVQGNRIAVWGLGPAGLVFIQLARAAHAIEVVGFDPVASRRELARRLGADVAMDPRDAAFPNRWFHCSFDCAGNPSAVQQAMDATSHLVVLFAVQREPYVYKPSSWGGLILAGTQPHTYGAAEYAVRRLREGVLDLRSLVTHVMPLTEYGRAVELLRNKEAVKVALTP